MGRHLHLDPLGGASGDMFLGLLLDLGVSAKTFEVLPERLGLPGVTLACERARRGSLDAGRVIVHVPEASEHSPVSQDGMGRRLRDVREIFARARFPARAAERVERVATLLFAAEAEVHGETIDSVHLHEAGADDAMIDIAGSCLGLEQLDVDDISCEVPIPLGHGRIRCAHGELPVPVPAVAVLMQGIEVEPGSPRELVTPTGGALLKALVDAFGPAPPLVLEASGYGAGTADDPLRANVLRGLLGTPSAGALERTVSVLECCVDDVLPQDIPVLIERLLAHGARDAFVQPVVMKKGRPGFRLMAVCDPEREAQLARTILEQGPTLGVRVRRERRIELARDETTAETPWGRVRLKRALSESGREIRALPEFDDVKRIADENHLPLHDVRSAVSAAHESDRREAESRSRGGAD